ncbi:MAG: hypothetical protein LBK52_03235, partial [Deltaproteobacteria bacterium]|nr:hypothetical protein [Deltaproteobacteria bacterium]
MARKNGPDPKKNLKSQGRETARSIDQYLENNNIEEARSLYESLSKLGRSPAADSLKAKAAFKLIRWYAENGKPENTGPLLSALARRSENPEILMLQVKAVSLMIGPRPEKEQTKEVRLLRQSLWTPQGQVSQRDRSQILLNLISELCQKNQTDEALEIYSTLKIDSLPEEAAEFLPSLESAIIISLTENGRLTEALDFFQASRNAAWSPDALNRAAPAAARLTAALACRQELDKALGVWSFFEIPVLPESVRHLRLKTALILMEILILYDRFQDALAVWHSLPKRKNYISESSLAGPLAEQIALIFPHLSGRPEEAKRLFLSSQDIFYLRRGLNAEERLRYYTGFMYTVRACAGTYLTDPENSLENLKWAAAETLIFGTDLNAFSPAPEE